jgi:hypothetical protein
VLCCGPLAFGLLSSIRVPSLFLWNKIDDRTTFGADLDDFGAYAPIPPIKHAVIFKTGAHGDYMSSSTPRCMCQSNCNLVRPLGADFATTFLTKYLPPEFAFIAPSFIPDSLIVRPEDDLPPPPANGFYAGSYLLGLSNSRQSPSGSGACSQEVRWETTSATGTTFLVPG